MGEHTETKDTGSGEYARSGLERIEAYYADLQAKCPHTRGFWSAEGTMCLECNAVDAVDVFGRQAER